MKLVSVSLSERNRSRTDCKQSEFAGWNVGSPYEAACSSHSQHVQ